MGIKGPMGTDGSLLPAPAAAPQLTPVGSLRRRMEDGPSRCPLSRHEIWVLVPLPHKHSMAEQLMETGGSGVQGHLPIHREFKAM